MAKCTNCDTDMIAWKHEGHRIDPDNYADVEAKMGSTPYGDERDGHTNYMCNSDTCFKQYELQRVAD